MTYYVGTETSPNIQRSLDPLAQGDENARALLLAHSRRRLVTLTQWMMQDFARLRRWEDTDDVLQRALMRLCRVLDELHPATTAEFFRIAALQIRRELQDLARHYFGPNGWGVRHAVHGQCVGQLNGGAADDSGQLPLRLAQWTEFHTAVESLPAEERQAFELIWYHELTQVEAATVMEISDRQLRRYWAAARLRLQRQIPAFFEAK
jgi:DNA-directed RNA polymerase specialized sigma24 family protein